MKHLPLLLLLLLAQGIKAQERPVNLTDSASVITWLQKNKIPALGIAYIENAKVKTMKLYGDRKPGSPAPINAVFNVASITKTITIMVTLNLVNANKWVLDEPIAKYWTDPDLKDDPRSQKLTSRHILTHRTGFPNWRSQLPGGKLAFQADPGTKYQYSGEGFEYLRHALENKFHRKLAQLADSIIFKPLGMKDSRLTWNDADEPRFAYPFDKEGKQLEPTKNTQANAADLLKTTIPDYTKFILWMLRGGGISKSLFGQMAGHQVQTKTGAYMGLGWAVYDPVGNNEYAISHGGHDPGVHTMTVIFPKSKRALLIFTNSDNGMQLYPGLFAGYLGEQGQAIVDIETRK